MPPLDIQTVPVTGIESLIRSHGIGHALVDSVIHEVAARLPTKEGKFRIHLFTDDSGKEHIALVKGNVRGKDSVLTRVHSECMTGDLFGSLRCDCGPQLHHALRMIEEEEQGILIYLRQEGRGIGLAEKLKAYNLQDMGYDTVDANLALGHKAEERDYTVAKDMLDTLEVRSIRLISNNPDKVRKLTQLGVDIADRVPMDPDLNPDNMVYLRTKIERMGHRLESKGLRPHMPEMDDVLRYVKKNLERKRGAPLVTVFHVSSLDGRVGKIPEEGPTRDLWDRLSSIHGSVQGKNSPPPVPDDTDFASLSGSLLERGVHSILVDGNSRTAEMLQDSGMVDIVVNMVLPSVSGSEHPRVRPLEFKEVKVVSLGSEVAFYGRPERP